MTGRPDTLLLGVALTLPLAAAPAVAQTTGLPPAVEAGLALRQMDGVKRVLLVAAHPDDEDTHLLTTLARGLGAEVAYFSFTRGEGGQNLIGPELGEGLGIVRTGELLAARARDGAAQYFSRAYDFGYSKNADETFSHWDRNALLHDLVWVVRSFRPQIIVSGFSGTPRDGHGQHQAAGLLAREAFEAAGDPDRFSDQLERGLHPWTPDRLYRRTFFDPDQATVSITEGGLDPLLGRSWFQLAMEARSQHRSQDFGTAQDAGSPPISLRWLGGGAAADSGAALFAGVDTTLAGLADAGPTRDRAALLREIAAYRDAVADAARSLSVTRPAEVAPHLVRALDHLRLARLALGSAEPSAADAPGLWRELPRRETLARGAIASVAGLRFEVRARDDVVVPGQVVLIEARLWNGGDARVTASAPAVLAPGGWGVDPLPADASVDSPDGGLFSRRDPAIPADAHPGATTTIEPGAVAVWRYRLTVGPDASTAPYYLATPRDGDVYVWPNHPDLWARPFAPPPVTARVEASVSGLSGLERPIALGLDAPLRYRGVDKASGEYWRPVIVAPRLSVEPDVPLLVWPTADGRPRRIGVKVANHDAETVAGTLRLNAPPGWASLPAAHPFELPPGGEARLEFEVTPGPAGAPTIEWIRPIADVGGRAYTQASRIIDYEHLEPRLQLESAVIRVNRFPVVAVAGRVGYVMGSGDQGAEVLAQLGLEPVPIEAGDWDTLGRFDVIVLGVRAYEVRADLIAANDALLDWVRRGGTLVVQYNKYEFTDGSFAPFKLVQNRPAPRVTDEASPVTLLAPRHPAFTGPNTIVPADFEGWVQERGLYFPDEWDDRYTPLLEVSDPDEPARRGSLLVARVGEGLYVHTSLSFFRQFPAGVPGAYRLFANLVSLRPADVPLTAAQDLGRDR